MIDPLLELLLEEAVHESLVAGVQVVGGTLASPVLYPPYDGVPRWHDRTTADGRVLRWRAPALSDAEAVDLAVQLAAVSDDCPGWADITFVQ